MGKITMTREELVDIAQSLVQVQALPSDKKIAVQYYLKGMLDNSLLDREMTQCQTTV